MDNIDTKEWLPRDVPVINRFRQQHGDLDGIVSGSENDKRITQAWQRDGTIIRVLIIKGFMDEIHLNYALDLLDLKNTTFGALNAKTAAFMHSPGDASLRRNQAEELYCGIIRRISLSDCRMIESACSTPYPYDFTHLDKYGEPEDKMSIEEKNVYRACFQNLMDVFDEELEKIREKLAQGVAL